MDQIRPKISLYWKLLFLVLLIVIPFLIYFSYLGRQTIGQMNQQLAEYQKEELKSFVAELTDEAEAAAGYLFSDCWQSEGFRTAAAGDLLEAEPLLKDCVLAAEELLKDHADIYAVALVDKTYGFEQLLLSKRAERRESAGQIRMTIQDCVESENWQVNTGWELCQETGKWYLIRMSRWENLYAVVLIDLADLCDSARVDKGLSASVVFSKGSENLTSAVWCRDLEGSKSTSVSTDSTEYLLKKADGHTYLVTTCSFLNMKVSSASEYLYNWSWFYTFIYLLAAMTVVLLLGAGLYLRRAFFRPLNQMTVVMSQITEGDTDARVPTGSSREFSAISDRFNQMVDALEAQKIRAYESELQARRAQMDSLRLQIRRHFFLNCLKNIYALASSGETELVKKSALLLSQNLRYTLDFHRNSIDLETELQQCGAYLELQGLGQQRPPELSVHVESGLERFQIPPVSILTFLENCCKYALRQDQQLKIAVSARERRMDDRGYVHLVIQDNGDGYDPQLLQTLNNEMTALRQDGHVGIVNTVERLRMMYGEECQVLFSNRDGARAEWIIPLEREESAE